MSDPASLLLPGPVEHTDETRPSHAPALPIEVPLVRAVRALEALSGQVATLLFVLEHAPRDDAQLAATMEVVIAKVNEASLSLWHLRQLRSCEGQS